MTRPSRKAVLYGRVSKADPRTRATTDHTTSVDQQINAMTEWAHRDGVEIVAVFRDDGISASRYAASQVREGWRQTMAAIVSGEVNELWMWETSRGTRDRVMWGNLMNACIAHGVQVCIGGRLKDPSDPDEGLLLDFGAAIAVHEAERMSKRIKRDVRARAAAGQPHGKLPYGFLRRYDPRTRELLAQEHDPETAPIVAEIARRVLAGDTMYSIAADLNRRGVPSPEAVRRARLRPGADLSGLSWDSRDSRDQALSPAAAAQRVHRGVVVGPAGWQPIISLADHAALTARILGHGWPSTRGPAKYLLTGIAECGVCGAKLRKVKNRGYLSYSCPGRERRGTSCVSRRLPPLDAMVTVRVVERLENPELVERVVAVQSAGDVQVTKLARELAEMRAELNQLASGVGARTGLAAATLMQMVDNLSARIEAKQVELSAVGHLPAIVLEAAGMDAADKWAGYDVDKQRALVRALVRVVVHRSSWPNGTRGFDASSIELIDM